MCVYVHVFKFLPKLKTFLSTYMNFWITIQICCFLKKSAYVGLMRYLV